MEKSPPRSYKKQQKIEKKNYSRKEKKLKVTNINQSLSTTRKVD
jgi:hypothetical protein